MHHNSQRRIRSHGQSWCSIHPRNIPPHLPNFSSLPEFSTCLHSILVRFGCTIIAQEWSTNSYFPLFWLFLPQIPLLAADSEERSGVEGALRSKRERFFLPPVGLGCHTERLDGAHSGARCCYFCHLGRQFVGAIRIGERFIPYPFNPLQSPSFFTPSFMILCDRADFPSDLEKDNYRSKRSILYHLHGLRI